MHIASRRRLLQAGLLPFFPFSAWAGETPQEALQALEKKHAIRIGVAALNTADGRRVDYRAAERFPMCSTFKFMLAAAILKRSVREPGLMQRQIKISPNDMRSHAPITTPKLGQSMSVHDLCAAVIQYSDNPAANILLRLIKGPAGMTAYARSIGDQAFRLDRWETELNTAIPGDPRDTTTPAAMQASVQNLVLGSALPPPQSAQLREWMIGNTTGNAKIRAGLPKGWQVADKTGAGAYGTSNDLGVIWPPGGAPIVIAIYTANTDEEADNLNEPVAEATRIAVRALLGAAFTG